MTPHRYCLIESGRRLVESNRGLCAQHARHYRGRGLTFDELMSAGFEGLCHAAAHYREAAGWQFCTYAQHWIKRAIIYEIEANRIVARPRRRPKSAGLAERWDRGHDLSFWALDEEVPEPDRSGEDRPEMAQMRAAIEGLEPFEREILERRLAGDMPADIGRSYGVPAYSMQLYESRAVTRLRQALGRGRSRQRRAI